MRLVLRRSEHRFVAMSSKLSDILRNALKRDAVASTARSYEHFYSNDEAGSLEQRKTAYKDLTNKY